MDIFIASGGQGGNFLKKVSSLDSPSKTFTLLRGIRL
jgi:hypothetical protein